MLGAARGDDDERARDEGGVEVALDAHLRAPADVGARDGRRRREAGARAISVKHGPPGGARSGDERLRLTRRCGLCDSVGRLGCTRSAWRCCGPEEDAIDGWSKRYVGPRPGGLRSRCGGRAAKRSEQAREGSEDPGAPPRLAAVHVRTLACCGGVPYRLASSSARAISAKPSPIAPAATNRGTTAIFAR